MAETLWSARGKVREVKPSTTPSQATNFINRRIRNVLDTRTWSDTMKFGMIIIPNATIAGTVTMTQGSTDVAGAGTSWPVNDRVNTVITEPISDSPGFMEIKPASLLHIEQGDTLLLDQENASVTEVITVQAVGPVSFLAYCQYAHDQNVTVQASSLAGLQFTTNDYTRTVQAVLSSTSLRLDLPWGGQPQANVPYQIRKEYCRISPTARFLKYAYDAIAGQPIGVKRDETWVLNQDPQDQSTGNPLELAMMRPTPGGVMQWMMWPCQVTDYAVGVQYEDGWPTLHYDTDLLPPFINPEVIIAGSIADALRTRSMKTVQDKDPYYDPGMANSYWEPEYARLLEAAIQSDQGRRLTYLTNWKEDVQAATYNFLRNHALSAGAGWGGNFGGGL